LLQGTRRNLAIMLTLGALVIAVLTQLSPGCVGTACQARRHPPS
jgi:hypothetical protein